MSWGENVLLLSRLGSQNTSSSLLLFFAAANKNNNNNKCNSTCVFDFGGSAPATKNEVTPQTRLSVVLKIIKLFFFLMSVLQRLLNCKYLKIGSGAIVYYHGIHIEYFPSGNKYLFQKGNTVRMNCFQMVTHRDRECPYFSTLWRSYTHFSDNTMTVTSRPVSHTRRLTQFFFFLLLMSHSQG